jgi:hypothetical protein
VGPPRKGEGWVEVRLKATWSRPGFRPRTGKLGNCRLQRSLWPQRDIRLGESDKSRGGKNSHAGVWERGIGGGKEGSPIRLNEGGVGRGDRNPADVPVVLWLPGDGDLTHLDGEEQASPGDRSRPSFVHIVCWELHRITGGPRGQPGCRQHGCHLPFLLTEP